MEKTETPTQRIFRQLGGHQRVADLLKEKGIDVTRQAVSHWADVGRIGGEYRLPLIAICQDDGLDFGSHPELMTTYRWAMIVSRSRAKATAA